MKQAILTLVLLLHMAGQLFAAQGVVEVKSAFSVKETSDRLEEILKNKGMTVFTRINHGEGAMKAGVELRETELIIFGNPKVGSPLMKCQQSVAIDLPQKALIWQDDKGQSWISYNDPLYLKSRHDIQGCDKVIAKISSALAGFTKAAAEK